MRVTQGTVLGFRAVFGLFFLVLGAVTLYHVVGSPASVGSKLIGGALAVGLIVLGGVRVVIYLRTRSRTR